MKAVQIVMPSEGDMSILHQEGGTILLQPVFYGGECVGPHIRMVDVEIKDGVHTVTNVDNRYRLRIRDDGKIELKRGLTAEEGEKTV